MPPHSKVPAPQFTHAFKSPLFFERWYQGAVIFRRRKPVPPAVGTEKVCVVPVPVSVTGSQFAGDSVAVHSAA